MEESAPLPAGVLQANPNMPEGIPDTVVDVEQGQGARDGGESKLSEAEGAPTGPSSTADSSSFSSLRQSLDQDDAGGGAWQVDDKTGGSPRSPVARTASSRSSIMRRSMRQRSMTLKGASKRPVGLPTAWELRKRKADRDQLTEFPMDQENDGEQTNTPMGYKVAGLLVWLCVGSFIGYVVAFVVPNPTTRDCMLTNLTKGGEEAHLSDSATSLAVVYRRNTADIARNVLISAGFCSFGGVMYVLSIEQGIESQLATRLLWSRLALAWFLVYGSFAPNAIVRIIDRRYTFDQAADPNHIGMFRDALFGVVGILSGSFWCFRHIRGRVENSLARTFYSKLHAQGVRSHWHSLTLRKAVANNESEGKALVRELVDIIEDTTPTQWKHVSQWTHKQPASRSSWGKCPNFVSRFRNWLCADWATMEMTALAVLARDCQYQQVMAAAMHKLQELDEEEAGLLETVLLCPSGLRTSFTRYGFPDDESLGYIPLHFAARCNPNAEVIRELLFRGDKSERKERLRKSQLDCATPVAMVKLVSKGTRSTNGGGDLPLHLAARYNPDLAVKQLLADADPSTLQASNARGHTPFEVARLETTAKQLGRWFLRGGAWIQAFSAPVWTAVGVAQTAIRESQEMIILRDTTGRAGVDPQGTTVRHYKAGDSVRVIEEREVDDHVCCRCIDDHWISRVDATGEIFAGLSISHVKEQLKRWPTLHNTYLERYKLHEQVHVSRTAEVFYADDVHKSPPVPVCLKLMKNLRNFKSELEQRQYRDLSSTVEVLGWHAHEDEQIEGIEASKLRPEPTDSNADDYFGYVLVMKPAERSLLDVCSKERLAGYTPTLIIETLRSIFTCVLCLHSAGVVHGDLKPRNILRTADKWDTEQQTDQYILCDLDASAALGKPIGEKSSSAYAPPERERRQQQTHTDHYHIIEDTMPAQWKHVSHPDDPCYYYDDARNKRMQTIPADTKFDVWSLGVVTFELCAGEKLFRQDLCNDELVEDADRTRLQTWHTIDDAELEPVFGLQEASATEQQKHNAKALIRWCLKGKASERPTVQQMLDHPFITGSGLANQPMQYFAFLSHSQLDASGTVATLYHLAKQKGLFCWIDMRQEVLTLDGMRQGVRDSDVFILVLSQHVLNSWYVQQEILCAIQEQKPIQLLVEDDPRFNRFDVEEWMSDQEEHAQESGDPSEAAAQMRGSYTMNDADEKVLVDVRPDMDVEWQKENELRLTSLVVQAINDHLPEAITFRRRDFEQDAMLLELCKRNGLDISTDEDAGGEQTVAQGVRDVSVLVVCEPTTATKPLAAVRRLVEKEHFAIVDGPEAVTKASHVLLLLTPGVLQGDALKLLESVLQYDTQHKVDRIVAVYDPETWRFDSDEKQKAPNEVKACLNKHEAIAYRHETSGANRHEHPAMMKQLLKKLRVDRTSW